MTKYQFKGVMNVGAPPYHQPGMNPGVPRRAPDHTHPRMRPANASFSYDPVRRPDEMVRMGQPGWIAVDFPPFCNLERLGMTNNTSAQSIPRKRITLEPAQISPHRTETTPEPYSGFLDPNYFRQLKEAIRKYNITEEEAGLIERIFGELSMFLGERVKEVIVGARNYFANRKYTTERYDPSMRIFRSSPNLMNAMIVTERLWVSRSVQKKTLDDAKAAMGPVMDQEDENPYIPNFFDWNEYSNFILDDQCPLKPEALSRVTKLRERISPEEIKGPIAPFHPAPEPAMWEMNKFCPPKRDKACVLEPRDILTYLSLDPKTNKMLFAELFRQYLADQESG